MCKILSPAAYVFQTQASQSALWRGARLWNKPRYHRSPSSSQSATKMGHSPRCVSTLNHQDPYITSDTPEHEKWVIQDSHGILFWLQGTRSLPVFLITNRILGRCLEKCTLSLQRPAPLFHLFQSCINLSQSACQIQTSCPWRGFIAKAYFLVCLSGEHLQ